MAKAFDSKLADYFQKPRFEDNGDIEPCDTESRMINRPDDFGERESSSSVSRVKQLLFPIIN